MIRRDHSLLLFFVGAGRALAAPLAALGEVGNSTSVRSSTTVFWAPHAGTVRQRSTPVSARLCQHLRSMV
jgi:hypothetical protein